MSERRSLLPYVRVAASSSIAAVPLRVRTGERRIGLLNPETVKALETDNAERSAQGLRPRFARREGDMTLAAWLADADRATRTAEIAALVQHWREQNLFGIGTHWKGEIQHVFAGSTRDGEDPIVLDVARSATAAFGFPAIASNVNGYVVSEDGSISVWVGKRAANKSHYPGALDTIGGGGLDVQHGPFEAAVHEAHDKAGLAVAYLRANLKSVGFVSLLERGRAQADIIYCYDLQMPANMIPHPLDGEVESFTLLGADAFVEAIPHFSPDASFVAIDFAIRHGIVLAANEPHYASVCAAIRNADVVPEGL